MCNATAYFERTKSNGRRSVGDSPKLSSNQRRWYPFRNHFIKSELNGKMTSIDTHVADGSAEPNYLASSPHTGAASEAFRRRMIGKWKVYSVTATSGRLLPSTKLLRLTTQIVKLL